MKTNKEIIIGILDNLENTIGLNWPCKRSKINKDRLIECWSEYRKYPDWKYYKYTNQGSSSVIYSKLFKQINKEADKESWKSYILRLYGYKYCSRCEVLHKANNFTVSISMVSKLKGICKDCSRVERKDNSAIYAAHCKNRRAIKLNRTPKWLNEEDHWMFKEIYSLAKLREELTGIKWHVDHIIPLQGALVSGLHVPTNLQVITATENLSKSNKFNV